MSMTANILSPSTPGSPQYSQLVLTYLEHRDFVNALVRIVRSRSKVLALKSSYLEYVFEVRITDILLELYIFWKVR